MNKQYLGDGVYVNHDGYQIKLTAENGIAATDTIYLEPSVLQNLFNYAERLKNTPVPDTEHKQNDIDDEIPF
jgi:hypothetical protein